MLIFSVSFQIDHLPEGDFFKRGRRGGDLYIIAVTHEDFSAESSRPLCDHPITALGETNPL